MPWIKSLVLAALSLGITLSPTDIYTINTRRSYYPHPVAPLFENKFTYRFDRLADRFFTVLDINRYLFSGHPREHNVRR